jgi:hypothetical protein
MEHPTEQNTNQIWRETGPHLDVVIVVKVRICHFDSKVEEINQ